VRRRMWRRIFFRQPLHIPPDDENRGAENRGARRRTSLLSTYLASTCVHHISKFCVDVLDTNLGSLQVQADRAMQGDVEVRLCHCGWGFP